MNNADGLLSSAKKVLEKNDRGNFTIPAAGIYPHQWLWDSCFIAIGQRHLDPERAKLELLSLIRGQWKNGMLPHIIFTPGKKQAMHQGVWQSWLSPQSPDDVSTSGITQPPMLTEAVLRVGQVLQAADRHNWYRLMWPNLLRYHEWIYRERDPHGEGLALLIHPWETGMDNTPPWMDELSQHLLPWWIRLMQKSRLDSLVSIFRSDTRFVRTEQRLSNVEALALYDTQMRLRRKAYSINRILNHSLFAIEDLAFNCIFVRANTCLREIASSLREEIPSDLGKQMLLTEKSLDKLWDPYSGQYFSRHFVTHNFLKQPSVATLLPLYAGSTTHERAEELVSLIENEHQFGTPYPAPSTPVSSPWFNPVCYWQGPSWVNINWLIIDGLRRYGFKQHAAALTESTLEMIARGGCSEYFNPLDGAPLGISDFSWTAALAIDLLNTHGSRSKVL